MCCINARVSRSVSVPYEVPGHMLDLDGNAHFRSDMSGGEEEMWWCKRVDIWVWCNQVRSGQVRSDQHAI